MKHRGSHPYRGDSGPEPAGSDRRLLEVDEDDAREEAEHDGTHQSWHLDAARASMEDVEGQHRQARREGHEADGDAVIQTCRARHRRKW